MAIKKSDLYSSLWASCDEQRGGDEIGLEQQLDEKREEQSGEEGLLIEVIEGEGEKQKIIAKAVKARLKEIARDPTTPTNARC